MRHGRAKATRKTLQFFSRTHGYAPPYHLLLDGTFVVSTLQFKIPVLDRLRSVLQGESFHLYVTRSTLTELHQLQKAQQLSNKEKGALLEDAYLWAATNATVLEEDEGAAEDKAQSSVNKGRKHDTAPSTHNSGTKEAIGAPAVPLEPSEDDSVNDESVPARGGAHAGMSAAGGEMYRIVTSSTAATASLSGHDHVRSEAGGHNESRSKGHPHDHSATATPAASRRYFFASQDEALLEAARAAGCVPIIRLAHHSVLLLEPPSREARGFASKSERHKWSAQSAVSDPERELVRLVREATKRPSSSSQQHGSHLNPGTSLTRKPDSFRQRKVKKAKGPNPLSCRKRETATATATATTTATTTAPHDGAASSKVGGDTRRQKPDAKDDPERPTKRRRRRK